jgi:hypothetical protein
MRTTLEKISRLRKLRDEFLQVTIDLWKDGFKMGLGSSTDEQEIKDDVFNFFEERETFYKDKLK